jgi:hypothetical protein
MEVAGSDEELHLVLGQDALAAQQSCMGDTVALDQRIDLAALVAKVLLGLYPRRC